MTNPGMSTSRIAGRTKALHRRLWIFTTLAIVAIGYHNSASAQDYPAKTVTIVVPLAAGSGVDLVARAYGERLAKSLGKPVIIENRPGAATMLGTNSVAAAPADGHTLLVATSSAMAINPFLYKKIAYDPTKDFVPIALYLKSPFVLVVHPDLPAKSVADLVKHAKERTVPLTFSSPGAGTPQHLAIEFVKRRFGVNMTHVPYRSNPQSISDVVAGHIDLSFIESGVAQPLIREGKVRGLAVSSATRLQILPELPPLAEASGATDFEAVSWHILFAPAATPGGIAERLHLEMKRVMSAPDMRKLLMDRGQIPIDTPPIGGVRQYIQTEQQKWGALVRALGLEGSQ